MTPKITESSPMCPKFTSKADCVGGEGEEFGCTWSDDGKCTMPTITVSSPTPKITVSSPTAAEGATEASAASEGDKCSDYDKMEIECFVKGEKFGCTYSWQTDECTMPKKKSEAAKSAIVKKSEAAKSTMPKKSEGENSDYEKRCADYDKMEEECLWGKGEEFGCTYSWDTD